MQQLFAFAISWFTLAATALLAPTVPAANGPFHTEPDSVNLPVITITETLPISDNGYLFLATFRGFNDLTTPNYLIILDQHGDYIYFSRTPENRIAIDFKVTTVAGVPQLSYFVTQQLAAAWAEGEFRVLDDSYREIDRWQAGNGYTAENHELLLLDNGNALLMTYVPVTTDLRAYGGKADAQVVDVVIQELTPARTVAFEWHSLDHIPITATYVALTTALVDYAHANALAVDADGQLLVSLRNTSQILKIDRSSGAVIWQLGGKQNEFTFVNDGGFAFQHDIRRLADGQISLFDNGNGLHPTYSRAVAYALDEVNKTITRTWQVTDTHTVAIGNAQRLPSGNTLVNWGLAGKITEVTPASAVARTIHLGGDSTYRAFRLPWVGTPTTAPKLALETVTSAAQFTTTLYMSWNGATQVDHYTIYGGTTPANLTLLDSQPRQGFESSYLVDDEFDNRCFWQIAAHNQAGEQLGMSAVTLRDTTDCIAAYGEKRYLPLVTAR